MVRIYLSVHLRKIHNMYKCTFVVRCLFNDFPLFLILYLYVKVTGMKVTNVFSSSTKNAVTLEFA